MKLKFWDNWDEDQKQSAIRLTGILVAILAAACLISCLSYLFHWKEDMSLLSQGSVTDIEVGNMAGRQGFNLGRLLICDYFGLGSFAFLVILFAVSARLIADKWSQSLVKTFILTMTGALLASVTFAFIGSLAGADYVFGGGLGGRFGTDVIAWSFDQVKPIITGSVIVFLILCWLFFGSRAFSHWLAGIGKHKEKEKEKDVPEERAETPEIEMPAEDAELPVQEDYPEEESEPIEPDMPDNVIDADNGDAEVQDIEIIEGSELTTTVTTPLPRINNRLDPPDGLPRYVMPSLDLLDDHSEHRHDVSREELSRNNNLIRTALANFKINVLDVKAMVGPTVTLYKIYQDKGVKIAEIKRLQDDIAMSLNANGVRIITLSDSIGIEVANARPSIVPLKALLNDESFKYSKAELPVSIGYTIATQKVKVFDLADAPHLLVAGATKQGKSVGLNVIVSSLLYAKHPSELKFVFIDPKMVEFSAYNKLIKHYLAVLPEAQSEKDEIDTAIVKSAKSAERILRSLCIEMDERYKLLSDAEVNNISLYNNKYQDRHLLPTEGHRFLPYLVTVVDEYADLTMTVGGSPEAKSMSRSITNSIIRLAQKGRAAGMHVILATQRPSVDVISGLIKTNFPMRIAFKVSSRIDSTTILDSPGAEKLIGKGDMLFSAGIETERIQCGYVDPEEIGRLTKSIGAQAGPDKSYNTPYYLPVPPETGNETGGGGAGAGMDDIDERFEEAAKLIIMTQKASTSYLQTKLGMGYAKAARVMSQLEEAGIVGPQDGAKSRQILVDDLESLKPILNAYLK